ncbi:hypothetical protein ABEG17_08265 [Pedococcus sp. KACC 23699]|uniref:SpoVT-AbrB domain-containing protein n=1 Tax=Pedococcus sp. KACC 23699 TaxID=3149228 RepID=A0AAU7JYJ7_9MICO
MDTQHRLFVTKVAAELGWTPSTALVLTIAGGSVVVRPGTQTGPELTPVRLDAQGRLRLPTRVLATLDLQPSDAVLAVGLPQLGELRLFAATDVAQLATGPLTLPNGADEPDTRVAAQVSVPARASRVRAAFKPVAPA